jgi:hypothetical protein
MSISVHVVPWEAGGIRKMDKDAILTEDGEPIADITIKDDGRVTRWEPIRNVKPDRVVRIIVCGKCFNTGGSMERVGKNSYIHARGQCGILNTEMRYRIYGKDNNQVPSV